MFAKIAGLIILVVAAAWIQGANFYLFGVKPNWVLTILIVSAFMVSDFWLYAVLVFLGAATLRFQPVFSWELVALVVMALALFWAARYLPLKEAINFIILLTVAPPLFYLLTAPRLLYLRPGILLLEIVYNFILGFVFILIFKYYAPQSRFRF